MGLLDSLLSGGSGGLLDFLRNNALNQQFSSGLPSDQAQYGAAPSNAYAQMQPNPAMMQPVAPQQPPPVISAQPQVQAPQPQGPSFGDNLMAGFQGFAAPSAGGLFGHLAGGLAGFSGQGNLTEKALLSKGVDPAAVAAARTNPDLMKTLVTQAFGPDSIQALGNGYIYHNKTSKIERAYEPEDKIPSGFSKGEDGNMHFVPGGPADPAYQRMLAAQKNDPNAVHVLGQNGELYKVDAQGNPTVVHKNTPALDATLDDTTTQAMADQYLAGDRTVLQNLGRGAQGAANIVKLRQAITQRATDAGVDPKGIVNNFNEQAGALAGQRAIGTRAANISLAANEANNMIPIALEASDKLPRSQYMPWNQMVQAVQKGTSSPELASFVAATNSLVNSYVRAVSPSGVPTDAMRQHAYDMLNAAQGPEAYKSVVNTMQLEMKAALQAPSQVREELKKGNDPTVSEQSAPPTITRAEAEAELRRRGKIK